MCSTNVPVINVNGLNKQDSTASAGKLADWKNLDAWIKDQESYFNRNKINSDEKRINHIILNVDVRHWKKLEDFFKYNQQPVITYETMKRVLLRKIRKAFDPSMAKYDEKVDGYIDKLNFANLDLNNLQAWLKKLRFLCDGQAKEEYLTTKILSRLVESKRRKSCTNLMAEIKAYMDIYEERIKMNNDSIGKEKQKELKRLTTLRSTIKTFLN